MDSKISKELHSVSTFNKFQQAFLHNKLEDAEFLLYEFEDMFTQIIKSHDFFRLNEIVEGLSDYLDDTNIDNMLSFIYGKIFTIVELAQSLLIPHEIEERMNQLTPNESKVLNCIGQYEEVSVTELANHVDMSINYTSNLLSNLRSIDAVFFRNNGKTRLYSLAPIGREIFKRLNEMKLNNNFILDYMDQIKFEEVYNRNLNIELKIDYRYRDQTQASISNNSVSEKFRYSRDELEMDLYKYKY